jgi:hypothetical protein
VARGCFAEAAARAGDDDDFALNAVAHGESPAEGGKLLKGSLQWILRSENGRVWL